MSKEPYLCMTVFLTLPTSNELIIFSPKALSSSFFSISVRMESSCFAVHSEKSIQMLSCQAVRPLAQPRSPAWRFLAPTPRMGVRLPLAK